MSSIPKRSLGKQGLVVPAIGLGCMGMTAFYGGTSFNRKEEKEKSLKCIDRALELGVNFLDTAWIYQSFGADGNPNETNEELISEAIVKHGRDKFIIATKFGIIATANGLEFSGKEELIRSQLSDSLTRLKTNYIDLYYMHRMDPQTPIEDTMKVLKSLVDEGKIKYIGLSECTPNELRRAHKIHPITCIQQEWSLQTRDLEDVLVPVCRELGVGIVAYSPLGRGLLSKSFETRSDIKEGDWRLTQPRFSEENFDINLSKTKAFYDFAATKNVKPSQLALAWLLKKGDDIVPIPGTKTIKYLEENVGAIAVSDTLSADDMKTIESFGLHTVEGERYSSTMGTFNSRLENL